MIRALHVAVLGLGLLSPLPASAADFYAGKTITLLVGSGAGGGFDAYSRLLARWYAAHIPGAPTIVVQNMTGAGGLTATSYLYNVAAKDGTVILEPNPVNTLEPLLNPTQAKFDARQFNWIGSLNKEVKACGFWSKKVRSLDDLRTQEVLIGASGPASGMSVDGKANQMLLGLRFKLIQGYSDTVNVEQAARQGELDGFCGLPISRLKSALWGEYQRGEMKVLIQMAIEKHPEFPDVPSAFDLVTSPRSRQVLLMLYAPWTYGQPIAAPPGVPADRISVLRTAFMATMRDPAFLADAKQLNMEVNPIDGEAIAKLVADIYESPPEVIEEARTIYGLEKR